nr:YetF domain-containing protein [Thermoflavimicrobium dichotomicum]
MTLNHPLKPFSLPVPVILDGEVQDKELSSVGFNRFWLKKELKKQGYHQFKDVFFASVDSKGKLYVEGHRKPKN